MNTKIQKFIDKVKNIFRRKETIPKDIVIFSDQYGKILPKIIKTHSKLWDEETKEKMCMLAHGGVIHSNIEFYGSVPYQITISYSLYSHAIIIWHLSKKGYPKCEFIQKAAIFPF